MGTVGIGIIDNILTQKSSALWESAKKKHVTKDTLKCASIIPLKMGRKWFKAHNSRGPSYIMSATEGGGSQPISDLFGERGDKV